jgi:hypothetical protein
MTTIIVPFYDYLNGRIKRLWNITNIAKRRSLYFSSHDEVGSNVIAVDVNKRKLLYLKKASNTSSCLIIDLSTLEKCSVRKEYNSISAGELKTKKLHHFLKSIFLHLGFKNKAGAITLPLYQVEKDSNEDIIQIEAKARKWETIVSKFKPMHIKEIA